jgi:hypothetical protein
MNKTLTIIVCVVVLSGAQGVSVVHADAKTASSYVGC